MIRHLVDFKCDRCKYVTTAIFFKTAPAPKVRCPRCPGVATYQFRTDRHKRCGEVAMRQARRSQ